MSTQHFFLSSPATVLPERLHEAFADIQALDVSALLARLAKLPAAQSLVWLSNTDDQWQEALRQILQAKPEARVVVLSGVPEPTEGRGRDYGVMLDVLGDDRLFIRTTWFETKQLNDSPILPGSNALGVDNLATMLNQLLNARKITQADYDAAKNKVLGL